jgi:hypothetical protein
MADHSEACRANALRCFEVAEKTHALEDRLEFIGFAESWERLAKEIERNQLLITLIDELAASSRTNDTQLEPDELTELQRSGTWSLRRLASAVVSISDHFISDHFATRVYAVEESGYYGAAAESAG